MVDAIAKALDYDLGGVNASVQVQLAKLNLEREKLAVGKARIEQEERMFSNKLQYEVEMKALEFKQGLHKEGFDMTKNIRLVPHFNEELDVFF